MPEVLAAARAADARQALDDTLLVLTLLLVAVAATAVVLNRDPARQAVVLSLLGLSLALLFTVVQAPDVALSQLGVGSAVTPLMVLLTVRRVRRKRRE
ncbi:hydrogenase subunit MbhD domain-containing protein [Streptomyces sp. NPDC049555]|uniref:hydrogenase subunit MbhD domain-containing protein n=1 Tax=unclassified Streptomyces TaxID=2593676 RepID=UPI00342D406F